MNQLRVRTTWIVLLLTVALALAACGGDSADVSVTTGDGEPTAAAEPAEEAAATDVPPTPAPTETAAAPVPTDEPTATAEPPTPTIAPTETTAPESASGRVEPTAGACGNPFFPVREGPSWRYQIASPDSTIEYTISYRNVTDNSFIAVQTFPDFSAESEWTCTENGLVSGEFFQVAFPSLPIDADTELETVDISGVTIPVAGQWQVGATWETGTTIRGEITVQGITTVAEIAISQQNEIVAQESITVGAGTFENAYRVESTGTSAINATVQGSTMSLGEFAINSTSWYVEGVGLVRNESLDDFGATTVMELVSLE